MGGGRRCPSMWLREARRLGMVGRVGQFIFRRIMGRISERHSWAVIRGGR